MGDIAKTKTKKECQMLSSWAQEDHFVPLASLYVVQPQNTSNTFFFF